MSKNNKDLKDPLLEVIGEKDRCICGNAIVCECGARGYNSAHSTIKKRLEEREATVEEIILLIKSDDLEDCSNYQDNKYLYRKRLARALHQKYIFIKRGE